MAAPPTTTATAIYSLETWIGSLTTWQPRPSCSAITEARTTIMRDGVPPTLTTDYRNNITHWETTSRPFFTYHCRPQYWNPTVTAQYYYPGSCPTDWTSYPTETVVTTVNGTATFTDAMCCPQYYTGYLLGKEFYCSRYYNATSTSYDIMTWNLYASVDEYGSTSQTSSSKLLQDLVVGRIRSDVVLTYWPVFVRYANPTATFTPTKTGEGAPRYDRIPTRTDVAGQAETKAKQDLTVGISIPIGVTAVLFIVLWAIWKMKRSTPARDPAKERAKLEKRERRRREYEERVHGARTQSRHNPRDDEEKVLSDERMEEIGKPELMGSVYVGPQFDGAQSGNGDEKPELDGGAQQGRRARGVVTSPEELKYDEMNLHDDAVSPEMEDGGRQGLKVSELDHQSRRRGVAGAELDAREQERRASELDGSRARQQRIARKQVPGRVASFDSQTSPRQSMQSDIPPLSPVLSGPISDFTTMYPSRMDTEALEEERRLEYQEERLRERREQLAREEEALRQKRAQKRSGA